ncbi:MAG TPA: zinc ribbon domain-containing protein, partial [Longimicrobium sp.]|nr:zinc ribbon domain-containing protein [Longimicrobium sp.]
MPLITCPDCGREVSDAAPACPHCGRPFQPTPSTPPAAPKPIAGIVVACVLGVLTLVWTYTRPPSAPPMDEARGLSNAVHGLGSGLLLIGALMSLGGHRWGNTVVRATSFLMIALVGLLILV